MKGFETVAIVDWSARTKPSPAKPTKDAIFIGVSRGGQEVVSYHRTRMAAVEALTELFDAELRAGRRVLAGFDFPFGYPKGFARAVTGSDGPFAVWEWLAKRVQDDARNGNNRFDVAEAMNARFVAPGPFWGCSTKRATNTMLFRKPDYASFDFAERRRIEKELPRAKTVFQLLGNGSVGSQSLVGLPYLQRLRERYGEDLAVSPFQAPDTQIVMAEIYPGLINRAVKARVQEGEILDAVQVRLVARAFASLPCGRLDELLREGDKAEGWILGLGSEAELIAGLE